MERMRHFMKAMALCMAVVMFATSLPITVSRAAMVPTDQVVEDEARAADRARVMKFMTREDVRRQLQMENIRKRFPENVQLAVLKPESERSAGEALLAAQVLSVGVPQAKVDEVVTPQDAARRQALTEALA